MKSLVVAILLCGVLIQQSLQEAGSPPYRPDEYWSFTATCARILRTSPQIVAQLEETEGISDSAEMQCLMRCVGIVANFYDDESGINWDQMARQMWAKERFEEYRQAAMVCTGALTGSGSSGKGETDDSDTDAVCKKFYQHYRCVQKSYLKDTL